MPPVYVTRTLDPEMIRLGNGAGLLQRPRALDRDQLDDRGAGGAAVRLRPDRALSNERSASEGNVDFDGREANHQHSKSLDFERMIAGVLADATGGALGYFSLLRPYSEAKIAKLFARETRFDRVFSSCNRNFTHEAARGPAVVRRMPEMPLRVPDLCAGDGQGAAGRHLRPEPARQAGERDARSAISPASPGRSPGNASARSSRPRPASTR